MNGDDNGVRANFSFARSFDSYETRVKKESKRSRRTRAEQNEPGLLPHPVISQEYQQTQYPSYSSVVASSHCSPPSQPRFPIIIGPPVMISQFAISCPLPYTIQQPICHPVPMSVSLPIPEAVKPRIPFVPYKGTADRVYHRSIFHPFTSQYLTSALSSPSSDTKNNKEQDLPSEDDPIKEWQKQSETDNDVRPGTVLPTQEDEIEELVIEKMFTS